MSAVGDARARYNELLHGAHRASTLDALGSLIRKTTLATPRMVTRTTIDELHTATTQVMGALRIAVEQLVSTAALRGQLGLAGQFEPVIALDLAQARWPLMARLNAFVGADGVARFLEYNAESSVNQHAVEITEALERAPIAVEMRRHMSIHTCDLHALALREIERELGSAPVIAVLGTADLANDSRWIPHVAARACWRVVPVAFEDLAFDGSALRACGQVVQMVALADAADITTSRELLEPVLAAVRAGVVRLPNGLARGLLAGYKSTFELLSDPEHAHLFDVETQRALRAHIPWTRVLRNRTTTYGDRDVDLMPFIAENRARFVIKPSGAHSGAGVVLGWEATDAAWQQAIKISRVVQSVVQERVDEGPGEIFAELRPDGELQSATCTADLDPFVVHGGDPAAALSRVARSGRHNHAAGSWVAPVWVLER
ncbi:hypothetical protein BH11MYX2_BH11MYX2_31610 [soil metagenome]